MINSSKTQCIIIGNRQHLSRIPANTVIKIDEDMITPSNHVKKLGLFIDQYMTFDKHSNELSKKVMFINRIRINLDKQSRIIVMQSLVLSIFNYCIRIWRTTNKTVKQKVQTLQNFASKVAIDGARKDDHVTPIIKELGWLKVDEKYTLDISTTVYKVLNGL